MPIIFQGKLRCNKCNRLFEWVYFETVRTKLGSGLAFVETLPKEPMAHVIGKDKCGVSQLSVLCSHCSSENFFSDDRI